MTPLVRGYEFPSSYNASQKHTPDEEAEAWAHVFKERWSPVWKAIQEFDAQALEAEALWGKPVRAKTDALRACVRELNVSMDAFIEDKASGGANFAADKEFAKSVRGDLYAATSNKENKLSQRIDAAVTGLEEEVKPHLARS